MKRYVFEWHSGKAESNRRNHGVTFDEAMTIFENEFVLTIEDAVHSVDENREKSIGWSGNSRLLVVIDTELVGNVVRVISARKATANERGIYAKELQKRLG